MKIKKKFRPLSLVISIILLLYIPLMSFNIYAITIDQSNISFTNIIIFVMLLICIVLIWYVYRTSSASIEVDENKVTLITYKMFKKIVTEYPLIDVLKISEDRGNNKVLDSQKTAKIVFKIRKYGDVIFPQNNYKQFKDGEVTEINKYLRNIKKK